MVVSDWYLADDYHADHGEGVDFYSAGPSRGCGGNGLWVEDKLWVSKNFVTSNVLANGPIRVLFELEYEPSAAGYQMIGETKRVSLDAGQQFDRFESRYRQEGQPVSLTTAIGLKKAAGEVAGSDAATSWFAKWEKMTQGAGHQGLAMITRPQEFIKTTEDKLNHLMLAKVDSSQTATYWGGFCWDKAGLFTGAEAWNRHVAGFAQGLTSPIEIKLTTEP